jgi:integrase
VCITRGNRYGSSRGRTQRRYCRKPYRNESRLTSPEWRDQGLVYLSRIGGPIDRDNHYYCDYKPLLKRASLDDLGFMFQGPRHPFATAHFERDQHSKIVQFQLGHTSITQTMETYSHLMEGMGGDTVDGLDEAFG